MEDYLKSINPKDNSLIPGRQYKLWRGGNYLRIAIWTLDENVGDSFQSEGENGVTEVWIPDKWELA